MADDLHFDDPRVCGALRDWWQSLDDHRRERAHLQRCRTLADLLALDDRGLSKLYRLHQALRDVDFRQALHNERLAYVAGTLAHLKADVPERAFAAQLAVSEDGMPRLSERRFLKLLQLENRDRHHQMLIRVLRMMNGQANLCDLAKGVFFWNERILYEWAREYYAALLTQDSDLDLGEQKKEIGTVAKIWWETLDDHPSERARLRRCHSVDEVLFQRGFHRFRRYASHVGINDRKHDRQLAAVAGLLAHVKEIDGNGSFARQIGAPQKKNPKRAKLSGLRFRRLLQKSDRDALYPSLIRAIHHLECKANVERLASDVYFWGPDIRKNWATDYWMAAPEDEK